jgi:hypothetical protein
MARRQRDMAGRRMRYVVAVLGLALLVIVGGIVLMMLSKGGPTGNPGTTSPSPTALAPGSPTDEPTASPSPSPTPEPPSSPTPLDEPTLSPGEVSPSPEVTGSPTPEVSASPTPAPTPAAPTREITFTGLGLDRSGSGEEMSTPRHFTFSAQGPGIIRIQVSRATGRVRACLWEGDTRLVVNESCRSLRRGEIERELPGGGPRTWTLSLIGTEPGTSPSVTVRISFPTNDVAMRLEGFRFQGTANEGYNGFDAEIRAAEAGVLTISATFDDGEGGSHPYRLVVQEIGGGPSQPFIAEGEGSSMAHSTEVAAERSYLVHLANRAEVSEAAVMLTADLNWP